MILNADRERYLFTEEDIVVGDVLANDKMAECVTIPQIRHDSDQEGEQSCKEQQWLPREQASYKEKQRQPIPGLTPFEQILIVVGGKEVCNHRHPLPTTRWCNVLNRYRCVLYDCVDNFYTLLSAHT